MAESASSVSVVCGPFVVHDKACAYMDAYALAERVLTNALRVLRVEYARRC